MAGPSKDQNVAGTHHLLEAAEADGSGEQDRDRLVAFAVGPPAAPFKSYYNLSLKHGTLKAPAPVQAAGLTTLCRTLRELLTFNGAVISIITQGVPSHRLRNVSELFHTYLRRE